MTCTLHVFELLRPSRRCLASCVGVDGAVVLLQVVQLVGFSHYRDQHTALLITRYTNDHRKIAQHRTCLIAWSLQLLLLTSGPRVLYINVQLRYNTRFLVGLTDTRSSFSHCSASSSSAFGVLSLSFFFFFFLARSTAARHCSPVSPAEWSSCPQPVCSETIARPGARRAPLARRPERRASGAIIVG